MNFKPKGYLTEDGRVINNNKTVEYDGEKLVERTLLEFFNSKDECIQKFTTDKLEYTNKQLLYLCLLHKAAYCRVSAIYEVEYES
jgi:hypothetical protein